MTFLSTFLSKCCFLSTFWGTFLSDLLKSYFFENFFEYFLEQIFVEHFFEYFFEYFFELIFEPLEPMKPYSARDVQLQLRAKAKLYCNKLQANVCSSSKSNSNFSNQHGSHEALFGKVWFNNRSAANMTG